MAGRKYRWTDTEDSLVRGICAGALRVTDVILRTGRGYALLKQRAQQLGLQWPVFFRDTSRMGRPRGYDAAVNHRERHLADHAVSPTVLSPNAPELLGTDRPISVHSLSLNGCEDPLLLALRREHGASRPDVHPAIAQYEQRRERHRQIVQIADTLIRPRATEGHRSVAC